MKIALTLAIVLTTSLLNAQKLKFKIEGQKDTTINLIKYVGKGLFYADTAEIKNGIVEFDGSKQKPGILAVFLQDQKMLEFVYNKEDVYIEASLPDVMGTAIVKKSEENKVFHAYVKFMQAERMKATTWVEQRKKHLVDSDEYKDLTKKISSTTDNVVEYQQGIVDNHWDKLVSRIVKMSMDIEVPDYPRDDAGAIIDSNFKFLYFRDHYFDNIDFQDDRLVNTPIFHNKLENYFSKQMMVQHWDTVLYYSFKLCDQLNPKSSTFQYTVSWITSTFEKSKIMGMDKVFVMMGDRYYCPRDADGEPMAHWMPEDKLETLCTKVNTHKHLVMGAKPPNLILRDTTDVNWKDFYTLDSEYTILYFWDPECGHCKKITPKLQTLYEKKFKERDIEIFSIGKAVGEDFEKWKKFIRENNLEFINVAVTDKLFRDASDSTNNQAKLQALLRHTTIESLNYQKTYDIFATPKVFVLNKDKVIIAKSLSISQLEDLMDRLQNKTGLEKLFPPEDDPEEEQMH